MKPRFTHLWINGRTNIPTSRFLFLFIILSLPPATKLFAQSAGPPPHHTFCAAPTLNISSLAGRRVYSVKEFGAIGDDATDDTIAIQRAFDRVPSGSILDFPEGTYAYSDELRLTRNDIVLRGRKAILSARTPLRQTLELKGNRTALIDMTLKGVGDIRDTKPDSTKVMITGNWVQIVDNTIEGGASAGIFVLGGRDFRIVGNSVSRTLADGIHMTYGARRGLVEDNIVRGTGDDMIAVVNYADDVHNPDVGMGGYIRIQNNRVSGNPWGRGITVVGGENVAIVGNYISDVSMAAGILVAQESSFKTGGVSGVLIEDNTIDRVEVTDLPIGVRYTHQAAIDINTADQHSVQYVTIKNNKIEEVGFSGIRVLGNTCPVNIIGNAILEVGRIEPSSPIVVVNNNCPAEIACEGNTAEGAAFAPPLTRCAGSTRAADAWPTFQFASPEGEVWKECR